MSHGFELGADKSPRRLTPIAGIIPGIRDRDLSSNDDMHASDHEIEAAMVHIEPADSPDARQSRGVATPSQYAYMLEEQLAESPYITEFLGRLENQVVVDLGAGITADGYAIASALKARGYVAVEKHFANKLKSHIQAARTEGSVPVAIAQEDILAFLQRLPDASVSILCSALSRPVISDREYIQEVEKEIVRVLHPQGAYVNYEDAIFMPKNLNVAEMHTQFGDLRVFVRPEK